MEKYQIEKKIGDGTFGSVYRASNPSSAAFPVVAIKKLKSKYDCWQKCTNLNEIKALMALQHPNVVRLLEVIKVKGDVYLVFEYMHKNLYQLLKDSPLDMIQIRNAMFQTLQGLHYIHSKNMFHRDLKPENILEQNGIIKIADFGLTRSCLDEPPLTDYISTRWYRAPEILLGSQSYDKSIDIFALGCIFAELVMRMPLFPGKNELDQLQKILKVLGAPSLKSAPGLMRLAKAVDLVFPAYPKKPLSTIINFGDKEVVDLIERMITLNPESRISAAEALSHPFFCVGLQKPLTEKKRTIKKPSFRQSIDLKNGTMPKAPLSLNVTHLPYSFRSLDRSQDLEIKSKRTPESSQITAYQPGANLFDLLKIGNSV
jgi:protein kinase